MKRRLLYPCSILPPILLFSCIQQSINVYIYSCLYKNDHKGDDSALKAWDLKFEKFSSRILCELASASYHFDIQPLVDQTCRAIAKVMSASDTAHELRETFGLDDCSDSECSCDIELRATFGNLDLDIMRQNNGNHSDDEEHYFHQENRMTTTDADGNLVSKIEEPSVDELEAFINGTPKEEKNKLSSKKRKKKAKKKLKAEAENAENDIPSTVTTVNAPEDVINSTRSSNSSNMSQTEIQGSVILNGSSLSKGSGDTDMAERIRLANEDYSSVFDESQFDDDDMDPELDAFKATLEMAHAESVHCQRIPMEPSLGSKKT